MLVAAILMLSLQQLQTSVPKPEEVGVFYHLDNQKLLPLERQTAVSEARWRMLGFGGQRVTAWIKGERSPVRLGRRPQFVLRAADPTKYQLYRYVSKKGRREIVLAVGGRAQPMTVRCRVTEVVPQVYRFEPAEDLPPGEYGFSPSDSNETFNFGVGGA